MITWDNPTTSGSPHSITAKVIDTDASEQTVTWTLTVTTAGFKFIDAINGTLASSGGTGTLANPWKSLVDMYEGNDYAAKSANSYAGEFLYFKNGTYSTSDVYLEDTHYAPFVGNYKPQVWLAYPGTSPVIDVITTPYIYSGGSNLYFDGLTFTTGDSIRKMGIRIASGASNVTFRRNTFNGENMVGSTGGNNALLFIENAGIGNFWSIQNNTGQGVTGDGYWLLGYSANKVLVENNTITNIAGHSIGPKLNTSNWHIRGNKITAASSNGINVMYYTTSGDIEVSYNYVKMASGNGISLNQEDVAAGGPIYVYRNTVVGEIRIDTVTSTNGPFSIDDNVIINSVSGDKLTKVAISDASRLTTRGTLGGTSGIIDTDGLLIEPTYSSSIGVTGWQLTDGSTPMEGTYEPPASAIGFTGSTTGTIR